MANAEQFARALERITTETIDERAVAAMQGFTLKVAQKLLNYSPIAEKNVPNKGLWKGNWRLSLLGRDTRRATIPDPLGDRTFQVMRSILIWGPKKLDGWGRITIGNPGRGAEQIGRRYGVIGFAVEDTIAELGL